MTKAAKPSTKLPTRTDGRKAMLIYMKPDIIADVKAAAAASDLKAWQFVERAVVRALKSKRS
ncbi:hypothetical protein [Bradyrhizobium japonicum]|uniref:hypothetical protein n=1 Tax=Bradyrhizobium japonicum TaxID=375 RepID=UPI001BA64E55|nr:hypothetical protein [Bradyrhizobium japonicum]MBR0913866.1 hypothetical protein [Bradyrhizobium japonicum]